MAKYYDQVDWYKMIDDYIVHNKLVAFDALDIVQYIDRHWHFVSKHFTTLLQLEQALGVLREIKRLEKIGLIILVRTEFNKTKTLWRMATPEEIIRHKNAKL
jgi:hypothetical protein